MSEQTAAPARNLPHVKLAELAVLQQERNGLTAAAGPPLVPPRAWFEMPEPEEGPVGWTVTADGQVYGHAAVWGTCHTGKPGRCITPPKSRSEYAYYRTGLTEVDDGELIPTGRITLGTGHASLTASPAATAEHYDNTGAVVADVAVRDGKHGIWVTGAVRPSVPPERIRELRGASLSGDWRSIRGALEMLGLLAVNVPGFPVPRAMSASGEEDQVLALVAAGMLVEEPAVEVADMSDEQFDAEFAALYASAKKRSDRYLDKRAKVKEVMREFKAGKLKSSSGDKVTSRKQAVAIALSEARNLKADGEPEPTEEELAAAAFDESKHPRHPKGNEAGGQFAPKGAVDAARSIIKVASDDAAAARARGDRAVGEFAPKEGAHVSTKQQVTDLLESDQFRAREQLENAALAAASGEGSLDELHRAYGQFVATLLAEGEAREVRLAAAATFLESVRQIVEGDPVAAAAFDESKHPRHPKGVREGGRFLAVKTSAGRYDVLDKATGEQSSVKAKSVDDAEAKARIAARKAEEAARPAPLSEEDFRTQLEARAQAMQRDIAGDHPDIDTAYEAYVRLNPSSGRYVGYIDMGEAGQWFFDDLEGKVEMGPMGEEARRLAKLFPTAQDYLG